jgi:hypothetical protein
MVVKTKSVNRCEDCKFHYGTNGYHYCKRKDNKMGWLDCNNERNSKEDLVMRHCGKEAKFFSLKTNDDKRSGLRTDRGKISHTL